MNIPEYISSGIVESYVLGLASDEERREFEKSCDQYPEVFAARIAFELELEKQAMENGITPSAGLKDKIFNEINSGGKIVSISAAPVRKINRWKITAIAAILLLAGSLYWVQSLIIDNFRISKENYRAKNNMRELLVKIGELQQKPNVKMASMKGMEISPASYATVYWDTISHDVYLLVNNLPVPASDKQYQLWALLNGKPVDLGVFDIKKERLLIQAKNAQGAEAFAITLENKGGSPTPTMEKIYVMGKL